MESTPWTVNSDVGKVNGLNKFNYQLLVEVQSRITWLVPLWWKHANLQRVILASFPFTYYRIGLFYIYWISKGITVRVMFDSDNLLPVCDNEIQFAIFWIWIKYRPNQRSFGSFVRNITCSSSIARFVKSATGAKIHDKRIWYVQYLSTLCSPSHISQAEIWKHRDKSQNSCEEGGLATES